MIVKEFVRYVDERPCSKQHARWAHILAHQQTPGGGGGGIEYYGPCHLQVIASAESLEIHWPWPLGPHARSVQS